MSDTATTEKGPSRRQTWLLQVWTEEATNALEKALQIAEHTGDLRLIARVRSRRDEVRHLRDDCRQSYLDLPEEEEG